MNSFLVLAALNLALSGLVFLLGLLILRESPRQRLNRMVSSMLFFGGFGSLLAGLALLPGRTGSGSGTSSQFVQHYAYLWEFFFPALFVFASIFPVERPFTRRPRSRPWFMAWIPSFQWLVFLPHAVHFILLFLLSVVPAIPGSRLGILAPLVNIGGLVLNLFLAVHQALFSLVNLAFGIGAVALLANSYRRTRMPRLRQQLRVIGLGLATCLVLYSLGSLIPTLVDLQVSSWSRSALTAGALLVGSGSIAYAIVMHKFLDAKLLARRGILYGTATAALVGVYLAIVVKLNQLLTSISSVDPRVIEPVFLVFALVAFQPVVSRLEDFLDRILLRDPTDHRAVLRNLGRELMTQIELEALMTNSIRTIAEALLLRRAYIVALPRDGVIVRAGVGAPIPAEEHPIIRSALLHMPPEEETLRLAEGGGEALGEDERRLLIERLGVWLAIPLRWRGETVGGLLLGQKITMTEYTAEDVALLSSLAGQMAVSLQNALLVRDRVEVARLEEEMRVARQIQRSFLVHEFPVMERFEVHALNIPSKEVGGDLYDLVPTGDGGFVLAVADVAGKGVPAALLSSMLQASLRTQATSIASVAEILRNINSLVYRGTAVHQFATFFLARLDRHGHMMFCNAGHNYPVVARRGGQQVLLECGGLVLGVMEGVDYEEEGIQLETGDWIVLYTDGISEAVNAEGEQFGDEAVRELIASLPRDLSARQIADRILATIEAFAGSLEVRDDMTLMVVRVVEPDPAPVSDYSEPTEAVHTTI